MDSAQLRAIFIIIFFLEKSSTFADGVKWVYAYILLYITTGPTIFRLKLIHVINLD